MPRGIGLTRMSSNSLLLERMASDLSDGHADDDEAFLVLTRMIGYAAAAAAARGMMRVTQCQYGFQPSLMPSCISQQPLHRSGRPCFYKPAVAA